MVYSVKIELATQIDGYLTTLTLADSEDKTCIEAWFNNLFFKIFFLSTSQLDSIPA